MRWITPDFEKINLSGEVTAYANTDDEVRKSERDLPRSEPVVAVSEKPPEAA
jgi:coenzyme PQQ precursor peptide PqqA